jgi:ankyrin repeat protein
MKRLIIAVTAFISFSAYAQKNTLLEQSFWQGQPTVNQIKSEIEKGNSPSQLNGMSFDPVVMAINAQAPTESIQYLLAQQGNEFGKLTHDGRTYLHWAANKGNSEVMKYLITKGAKANIVDSHGSTPLNFAASSGQLNLEVYDICLANGADLKKDLSPEGANALLLAVAGDKDFVLTNYFISKGLNINSTDTEGNNVFSYAARSGNIEMLKSLIQKGVKPNPSAMLMAAQGTRRGANSLAVYQYLETLNIKPAVVGKKENVLHSIVRKQKQNEIIKYFLDKGVDVNQADEEGNTVFMNAVSANPDTAMLLMLLPHVKNINHSNQKGITALAMAVRSNTSKVVSFLIRNGADMKLLDNKGNNLAYYLVESYQPQNSRSFNGPKPEDFDAKMKTLKEEGFDVTAIQKNGNTLYHLSVAKNDISLIKRLEPLGIDLNAKNKDGITALHKAAMISKDDTMMKYLISIGAKTSIATDAKETPFDLASENEFLIKNKTSLNFLK